MAVFLITPCLCQEGGLPEFEWGRQFGGAARFGWWAETGVYPVGMVMDKEENIFIYGSFESSFWIDGDSLLFLTSGLNTDDDLFIISYDSSGRYRWARAFGSDARERANGIAIDDNGNIVLVGQYSKQVWFDQFLAETDNDQGTFICKVSPEDGSVFDLTVMKGNRYDVIEKVAVGEDNSIWITGYTNSDTVTLEKQNFLVNPDKSIKRFIARLSEDAEPSWVHSFQDDLDIYDLEITSGDDLIVYVKFDDSLRIGDSIFTLGLSRTAALVKINHDGSLGWFQYVSRKMGGRAMCLDAKDNIYLTGGIGQAFELDSVLMAGYGLIKYSPDGELIWAYSFGQDRYAGNSIWVKDQVVYTVGSFYHEQVIEDTIIYSEGRFLLNIEHDILLLRHNTEHGNLDWFKHIKAEEGQIGRVLTGNNAGNLYLLGSSDRMMRFGSSEIWFSDQSPFFISRLSQDSLPPPLDIPAKGWLVFPNPTREIITLAGEWENDVATIELFLVDGRSVMKQEVQTSPNFMNTTISLPDELAQGIYFLKISQGNRTATYKLRVH